MANIIKPKRSNTAGLVPTTSNLTSGELGVNMADKKVYINNGTSVVQVGAGNLSGLGDTNITSPTNGQSLQYDSATGKWINGTGGAGDVTGASSSTDNALVRFDGTTGKVIQNSPVILDDSGNITGVNSISDPDYIQYNTTASATIGLGKERWNVNTNTLSFGIIDGTREVQIGQQLYAQVVNAEATTITKGQAVYLFQATGNKASVKLANNTGDPTSAKTLGLVVEDIVSGGTGFVLTQGVLDKLDTSAYSEGATLYLGATAGSLTATKPQAPNHLVYIGVVERANAGNGQIYVRVQNGYELDEIHDVQINSPANGQTIIYDASTSLWKNANITGGTGLSVTNGAGTIALANTGVTSAVAGTGISVSGATGAVTITNSDRGSSQNIFKNIAVSGQSTVVADSNDDTVTLANGTGVSITTNATTDTITITNTAPDQTVALTAGAGITTSGTYPNFTITNSGVTSFSAGTTGLTPSTGTTGAVTLAGTLAVANGGTGATTATQALTNLGAYPATNPNGYTSNTGTVTSIVAGTGLSGGTITTSGTIALANTAVTAGSYTNANITVDAQGRITSASSGSGGSGTVTSVSGTGTVSGLTLTGTVTSSGSLTLGGNLSITADMIYDNFTATAGQTTFTTSQTYTASKIQVLVNGVMMINGADVTVSGGTSVVMAFALTSGDRVTLIYPI